MKQYKVIIGEWVSVYKTNEAIISTDKNIENISVEEITKLLDSDKNTQIEMCDKADYDWSTEEHEEWDTHEDYGVKILEKTQVDKLK